jgi:hypothetical protein
MGDYVARRRLDYLFDHESILRNLEHDAPGWAERHLQEVRRFPCASEYGDVVLYRVLRDRDVGD